jgi:phage host-nuclease inhibitor protein Gam
VNGLRVRRPGIRAVLAAAVVLLLVAGACSDDDDGDGDEAARACDARDDLSASVQALGDVDVVAEGTDELRTAFDEVVTAVDEVAAASGDRLEDEVDAVQAEVDDVRTAVGSIGDQSAASAAELVGAEVGELVDSTSVLVEEASTTCD